MATSLVEATRGGGLPGRMLMGIGGLAAATALGLAMRMLDFGLLAVMIVLGVVALGLAWICIRAFGNGWSAVPALVVIAVPPFVTAVQIDVPILGSVVETTVADAPRTGAAGFRFRDAAVRTDLGGSYTTERSGRRSTIRTTYVAAPVVPASWKAGEPIAVWAIAEGVRPPAAWSERAGGLIRLLIDDEHDEVVGRATRARRLDTAPDRVIGRWVADPAAARGDAWLLLALILGGACALWAVLCVFVSPPRQGA